MANEGCAPRGPLANLLEECKKVINCQCEIKLMHIYRE